MPIMVNLEFFIKTRYWVSWCHFAWFVYEIS